MIKILFLRDILYFLKKVSGVGNANLKFLILYHKISENYGYQFRSCVFKKYR